MIIKGFDRAEDHEEWIPVQGCRCVFILVFSSNVFGPGTNEIYQCVRHECVRSSPPPSFTQSPSPPRSLVCDGQTSPHRPRLVVSRSTCPPLSPSPHANSFVIGTAVINTHTFSVIEVFIPWWRVPKRVYGGMLVFVSARTNKRQHQ